jgi:cytochrome o ubiquinol oxidase operon protein cyoD
LPRNQEFAMVRLALAVGLTLTSFWAAQTNLIYAPGVSIALVALGIAQMGIHLVFFLHITTAVLRKNSINGLWNQSATANVA